MYHVQCISEKSICPNCKENFNDKTLTYISKVNERVKQKEQKREQSRKDIKRTVEKIILFREKCKTKKK